MAGGGTGSGRGGGVGWALGCDLRLLGEPGAHMVPGGTWRRGCNAVYMAELRAAVLVYCPGRLRPRAAAVLASTPAGHLFRPKAVQRHGDVGDDLAMALLLSSGARLLYLRAAEAESHRPAGSAQQAGSTLAAGTVSLTRVAATGIGPAAAITVPARRAVSGASRPGPRW